MTSVLMTATVLLLISTCALLALWTSARARLAPALGDLQRLRLEAEQLRSAHSAAAADAAGWRARLAAEQAAVAERTALLEETKAQLTEQFEAMSRRALAANNEHFLQLADTRLKEATTSAKGELDQQKQAVELMVKPLGDTLSKLEEQLRTVDAKRAETEGSLISQLKAVEQVSQRLGSETTALVNALRKPQARGAWGEMQLRRVVEVAGMIEHCDFDEQATVTTEHGQQRPDMVVRLAGNRCVIVDAKVSLSAYLEAHESTDEAHREERLSAHARHLREHVKQLSAKTYWSQFERTPEFVVMFVPGESILAPAFERDPALAEFAAQSKVVIATPNTLIALLRTVAYSWQQVDLARNAVEIKKLGQELFERLTKMGGDVSKVGKSLQSAVTNYNDLVGSMERRVMVSARRFRDLKVSDKELAEVTVVEEPVRELTSPELVSSAQAARTLTALPSMDPLGDPLVQQIVELEMTETTMTLREGSASRDTA